jgi:hypothetical protein
VRTHPVDKLLEQHCYKSAAGLLQLVRSYVCIGCVRAHYSLNVNLLGFFNYNAPLFVDLCQGFTKN